MSGGISSMSFLLAQWAPGGQGLTHFHRLIVPEILGGKCVLCNLMASSVGVADGVLQKPCECPMVGFL